jgi:hypothetical protein
MKSTCALVLALSTVAYAAWLAPSPGTQKKHVSLTLVDRESGDALPGVVRIRKPDGTAVVPSELISRGWGLERNVPISDWLVVSNKTTVELPQAKLTFDAIAGIETERTTLELDLALDTVRDLQIPIGRFIRLRNTNWYSANTHLHLRNFTREESDQYLRQIPAADQLDALFISYLERADEDQSYVTNRYPVGRLHDLESAGVLVSNGEEHRHNFGPQGEGFGHVMLLGIKERVQPVSIGFGISKKHPDWPPIRAGIDQAHQQGGTAIWCHNNWGYEDVPNWIAGRLDAQNIFDGGSHGAYADSFYHYLNAGIRVPFCTGTDWFMYDFSRCYAQVKQDLTPDSWLAALRNGHTFITNGPLLDLQVNGMGPGTTIDTNSPTSVTVAAVARGRLDFSRLELVRNGKVVETANSRAEAEHFEAKLTARLDVSEPCWLAARVDTTQKNEYGAELFAHTSPVYITMGGRLPGKSEDIRYLLGQLESARSEILAKAQFNADAERAAILELYEQAIAHLETKLGKSAQNR